MEIIVIVIIGVILFAMTRALTEPERRDQMVLIVLGSYVLRLALQYFVMRTFSFFSHGVASGDCAGYENNAIQIAKFWDSEGFYYVTVDRHPELNLSTTSLIANVLAVVVYACGGEQCTVACTGLVAAIGLGLVLMLYRFSLYIGASEKAAFRGAMLTMFGPGFLYHTSDTYKDSLNAILVLGALFVSVQLARKFSAAKVVLLVPILWGLWNIRPYMVFMALVPVAVGLLGVEKFSVRTLLMMGVLVLVVAYFFTTSASNAAIESAQWQYNVGTSRNAQTYNQHQGQSGVAFDSGPLGMVMRVFYTVFAPFPWALGSIGMQIGKIDSFIWYFILFGAWKASRLLWTRNRGLLLLMLSFVLPATLAYALTIANVGLITRQRMPIMMATMVVATLYWTQQEREENARRTRVRDQLVPQRIRPGRVKLSAT